MPVPAPWPCAVESRDFLWEAGNEAEKRETVKGQALAPLALCPSAQEQTEQWGSSICASMSRRRIEINTNLALQAGMGRAPHTSATLMQFALAGKVMPHTRMNSSQALLQEITLLFGAPRLSEGQT